MSTTGTAPMTRDSDFALPPAVELHRYGQYTQISPAVEVLDRLLFGGRHVLLESPDGTATVCRAPQWLIQDDVLDRPLSRCWAGLEPLVVEALRIYGVEVRLTGQRPAPLPAPDLDGLTEFGALDLEMLDFIR